MYNTCGDFMLTRKKCIQLLKQDVTPALGCTEPVCVALCLANAAKVLDEEIVSIDVDVNIGIFKNGMSAGIPNFDHVGLNYAATLGAFLKNPEKGLKLFEDIDDSIKEKVYKFKQVQVHVDSTQTNLYVKGTLHTQNQTSTCIIQDEHTNVVFLSKNDEILIDNKNTVSKQSNLIQDLRKMSISDIVDLVNDLDSKDIEFLYDGVKMNLELADYAKDHNLALSSSFSSNLVSTLTAAIEARLSGCPLNTMSSSGAGTKGIALILPIHIVAREQQISKEKELKALALGHLLNRYVNSYIGKLSPMCTCVMASSTACSAALVYMFGGNKNQIGYAIKNMTGTVTGMICDGGKVGCSLKVTTGTLSALLCAKTALNNAPLKNSDGIVASTPEKCIQNIAYLSKVGMKDVDTTIVEIMEKKKA